MLLGFFPLQISWLNKKLCPVLAHISHFHPIPVLGPILCHTQVWPRIPAICHEPEFQVLMEL